MALPLNSDVPISKLDHYIIWKIFSINAEVDPYAYEQSPGLYLFPLTNTFSCSQVCSFWRNIILESPSIWGNCFDLEILWYNHDDWRRELLRRTGSAPLVVRDRHPIMQYPPDDMIEFTIDMISDHWERIKVLNISVAEEIVRDTRVQNAFRRPAPNLEVFAIQDERLYPINPAFSFPRNNRLFANNAPLLRHFCINHTVFASSTLIPIPSILRTGQLRNLTLKQPLVIPALDLLSACAQMPLLEKLSMEIVNLTSEDPQHQHHHRAAPALQPISLPRLKFIWITSQCLEIYPKFLAHLTVHPRKLNIHTSLDSMPSYPPGMLAQYVNESQDTLLREVSDFFQQNHGTAMKYLVLGLSADHISLAAYQEQNMKHPYFSTAFEAHSLPLVIQESFVNMLLHLNFPTTLRQFRFVYGKHSQWNIPSLSPFFKVLGQITALCTSLEGLAYIIKQSDAEGITLFESLSVVFLQDAINPRRGNDPGMHLKSFLTARQHTAPIEILNLTEARGSFGDLRYLDEIVGLRVVWNGKPSQDGRQEYVCGSGNPECLLHT